MKKNVLITGSSGLIGGRLYKHLSKQNFNCVGLSRSKDKFKFLKYNKKNLSEKIKKANIVINCIGQDSNNSIDKKSAYVANSKIPETIYKLAKKNKIELFIHFSSFHVYKNAKVIHELSKIDNSNIHKKSKLHGERALKKISNNITKLLIIRPCNLFGFPFVKSKNCWKLFINSMIKDIVQKGEFTIKSKKNNYRTFSSIESFCNFISKVIANRKKLKKKYSVINFSSKHNYSLIDLSIKISKMIKKNYKINFTIKQKYKKMIKVKPFKYLSKFQNQFYSKNDIFFDKEIKNLTNYCLKNFSNKSV